METVTITIKAPPKAILKKFPSIIPVCLGFVHISSVLPFLEEEDDGDDVLFLSAIRRFIVLSLSRKTSTDSVE